MQNGIFKLDWGSIGDTVLMAVVFAVLALAVSLVTAPNFNVLLLNWAQVGSNMLNASVVAAVVTLGKELLSTNSGSVLGVTPSNTN